MLVMLRRNELMDVILAFAIDFQNTIEALLLQKPSTLDYRHLPSEN